MDSGDMSALQTVTLTGCGTLFSQVTGPFLGTLQDLWTGAHGQPLIGMVVALEERETPGGRRGHVTCS